MATVLVGMLAFLPLAGCSSAEACGVMPKRPTVVRRPTLFGRVTADPSRWTVQPTPSGDARMVVGGRRVIVNAQTERLGYCGPDFGPKRCAAFVGLDPKGVAAWVLLASVPDHGGGEPGRMSVSDIDVWKVRPASLVLSQGVELPFGKVFAAKLDTRQGGPRTLRHSLQGRQAAASLWIDPGTGEVLDAGVGGCA